MPPSYFAGITILESWPGYRIRLIIPGQIKRKNGNIFKYPAMTQASLLCPTVFADKFRCTMTCSATTTYYSLTVCHTQRCIKFKAHRCIEVLRTIVPLSSTSEVDPGAASTPPARMAPCEFGWLGGAPNNFRRWQTNLAAHWIFLELSVYTNVNHLSRLSL